MTTVIHRKRFALTAALGLALFTVTGSAEDVITIAFSTATPLRGHPVALEKVEYNHPFNGKKVSGIFLFEVGVTSHAAPIKSVRFDINGDVLGYATDLYRPTVEIDSQEYFDGEYLIGVNIAKSI